MCNLQAIGSGPEKRIKRKHSVGDFSFDPVFYVYTYPDLVRLTDSELQAHWRNHGYLLATMALFATTSFSFSALPKDVPPRCSTNRPGNPRLRPPAARARWHQSTSSP